jgi:hypothetical protein
VPGPNYEVGDVILAADASDPRAHRHAGGPDDPNAPEEPEAPEASAAGTDTGPATLPADELVNPAATAPVESGFLTAPV